MPVCLFATRAFAHFLVFMGWPQKHTRLPTAAGGGLAWICHAAGKQETEVNKKEVLVFFFFSPSVLMSGVGKSADPLNGKSNLV